MNFGRMDRDREYRDDRYNKGQSSRDYRDHRDHRDLGHNSNGHNAWSKPPLTDAQLAWREKNTSIPKDRLERLEQIEKEYTHKKMMDEMASEMIGRVMEVVLPVVEEKVRKDVQKQLIDINKDIAFLLKSNKVMDSKIGNLMRQGKEKPPATEDPAEEAESTQDTEATKSQLQELLLPDDLVEELVVLRGKRLNALAVNTVLSKGLNADQVKAVYEKAQKAAPPARSSKKTMVAVIASFVMDILAECK